MLSYVGQSRPFRGLWVTFLTLFLQGSAGKPCSESLQHNPLHESCQTHLLARCAFRRRIASKMGNKCVKAQLGSQREKEKPAASGKGSFRNFAGNGRWVRGKGGCLTSSRCGYGPQHSVHPFLGRLKRRRNHTTPEQPLHHPCLPLLVWASCKMSTSSMHYIPDQPLDRMRRTMNHPVFLPFETNVGTRPDISAWGGKKVGCS